MKDKYKKDIPIKDDKTAYQDTDIAFMMDGGSVYVGNIVYERFHRSIPMHSHSDNSYEIHYISSGHGKVTVSGKEYDTLPGTLYITGPHVKHSMIPDDKDPLSEYCIYLKLSGDGKRDKKLNEQNVGYRTVVESIIKQIIISCVRNYSDSEDKVETGVIKPADKQYLIIEESFLYEYASLTLSSLASRLNLSIRQTQRLLTEHYGMNFQSKKTEAKMSAAALMLKLPDKTITDIADELGYSSVEHFSSAFKKFYGMSASMYRDELL